MSCRSECAWKIIPYIHSAPSSMLKLVGNRFSYLNQVSNLIALMYAIRRTCDSIEVFYILNAAIDAVGTFRPT